MQDNPLNTIEILWQKISSYLETKIQLLKLQAIDKSVGIIASILSKLILLIAVIFFLLFFNIGIALWIGSSLGKLYYGFFIVAGFYIIVGLLLYIFRKKLLKEPINNFLIKELLN
jgi:membrane protein implicated in regulation of membrane protease activity